MEVRLINSKNSKYYNYYLWNNEKYKKYDYERYGLLNKVLSNRIISTKNESLKIILNFIEDSMIFMMKYVDILRNFKNVRSSNR